MKINLSNYNFFSRTPILTKKTKKSLLGFTLIELLVVISIISLVSSIIFSSINSTRAKTRDTQRKIEFNQLQKALYLYFDKFGYYPGNMPSPSSPYAENFNFMAQTLVNEGFLSKVPISPSGSTVGSSGNGYSYYHYGSGNAWVGALLITQLETSGNTSVGIPPSCRLGWSNWCDADSNREYCFCFFYR